ncbi:MAG: hypothetical protein ACOYB8_04895 [Eubacteriaceae bacterium]|jgi:tetratricopeptide (TPR) repeat protein
MKLFFKKYTETSPLDKLCKQIKELVKAGRLEEAEKIAAAAVISNPSEPQPHNLMGIILEHAGDHHQAMIHFRAAWSLDPTYVPARFNIRQYGCYFCNHHIDAYTEQDCPCGDDIDFEDPLWTSYRKQGMGSIIRSALA